NVVGPLVAPAIDEEARRAGHPARVRARHVLRDPGRVRTTAELVAAALDVERQLLRIARQVRRSQVVLVREQLVVHLPDRALALRRLCGLRGELRLVVTS